MRSHSYINSAQTILQQYDGSLPFAIWTKQFFKAHKKYGSKDRREITHLCYSFFRLGNAFKNASVDERILLGVFLSSGEKDFVLHELKPDWNTIIQRPLDEKIDFLHADHEAERLFPFRSDLSRAIDHQRFVISFLQQPLLYLRIRPGKREQVVAKLQGAALDFSIIDSHCLVLANSSKIDQIIEVNAEAVIQDRNSQRVLELLPEELKARKKTEIWDCCAASGGKSILAYDTIPNSILTVSDVRDAILRNLKKRFEQAGIKNYKSFVADLSNANPPAAQFDLVICDAPCSGSGTWGRTPEQLHFFKEEKIEHYARLQKSIARNASRSVKEKGYFLYITCSVFEKENEEVVMYLQQNTPLQLVNSHYFTGYDKKADTMFAALFVL